MTIKLDQHGNAVQAARPAVSQNVVIGASSLQSTTFQTGAVVNTYNPDGTVAVTPNNTQHVRLVATSNCWVAFGTNPVAVIGTTPTIYLVANSPEYFWVNRGERVAVIQDTGAGILNVAELAQ